MTETVFFLRWDGRILPSVADPVSADDVKRWCHVPHVAELRRLPKLPEVSTATATTSPKSNTGVALSFPRAQIVLMSVNRVFAPVNEYLDIQVKILNILLAGCLVMQVRDAAGVLVYAERFPQKKLWRLAMESKTPDKTTPLLRNEKREKQAELAWADPMHSPYAVQFFISQSECTDPVSTAEIALNCDKEVPGKLFPIIGKNSVLRNPKVAPDPDGLTPDQTTVRCHSLKLDQPGWDLIYKAVSGRADWNDPGTGDADVGRMWLKSRLNALGYWAGPVDGVDTPDLKKAIRRFKLAHPDLSGWKTNLLPYEEAKHLTAGNEMRATSSGRFETTLKDDDAELRRKLVAGNVQKLVSKPPMDPDNILTAGGPDGKFFLDSHRFFLGEHTEFGSPDNPATKFQCDSDWLTRPTLPMRATLTIQGKTGAEQDVPLALGNLKLRWSWNDKAEPALPRNLAPVLPSAKPGEPSRTNDYVTESHAIAKPAGAWSGVTDTYGGILAADLAKVDDNASAAFARLHPVAPYQKTAQGVLIQVGDARDSHHKEFYGAALAYLQTSLIGGDNYRVKVSVDWDDNDNPATLKKFHSKTYQAETGGLVLWRRIRLTSFVTWPARGGSFDLTAELVKVKAEFAPCFVELDIADCQVFPIERVLTQTDYDTFVDKTLGPEPAADVRHLAALKGAFDPKKVWSRDPEEYTGTPAFDAAINRMTQWSGLEGDLQKGNLPDRAKTVMTMSEQWAAASISEVQTAGRHIQAELGKYVEKDAAASGAGRLPVWKLKTGVTGEDSSRSLAALSGLGSPLTGKQMEALILVEPVRQELRNYRKRKLGKPLWFDLVSKFVIMVGALPAPGGTAESALEASYSKFWNGLSKKYSQGGAFKEDLSLFERRYLLELRYWVISQRVNPLLFGGKMRLVEVLDLALRRKLAKDNQRCDGAMVLDQRLTDPVDADGVPAEIEGVAFGGGNGVAFLDQGLKSPFHTLCAHELAHCLYLLHWRNAPGPVELNHDQSDDNCMMSYPLLVKQHEFRVPDQKVLIKARFGYQDSQICGTVTAGTCYLSAQPHYSYDTFSPHFCGKCNLQIRGWKLRGGGLPDGTQTALPAPPEQTREVRFIPATQKDDARATVSLGTVGISYYPLNQTGTQKVGWNQFKVDSLPALPVTFGWDSDAEKDPGLFRVEVIDPNVVLDRVKVTLEARMPQYSGTTVSGWADFPGPERPYRMLVDVECEPIPGDPNCYRSRYIKLVTDEADFAKLYPTKQGLYVTDMADGLGGDNDKVEILDQKIKVTYDPSRN